MNLRIRELAEQAYPHDNNVNIWRHHERLEKFAELIIKECLKIVEPDQTSGDEWCVTLDETAQSIKQHFGIKQ